jgi:predicted Ser/Thr protein kinase
MDEGEPDRVRLSLERALGRGYRILRLLGRGGMGAVYLAREESLERLVAVKVLAQERGRDETSRERFKREARTAARLTHPNIVPLHAFGEADGMMYLVMGYVPGESLAARLKRDGRLGIAETRRIVADVADALDHAHRQGVVHRDVKPDNVLIDDESGRALLADFGIAKAASAGGTMTQAGTLIGTPHYMSPEQAAGRSEIDGRSDLYSLGALAYTLLSGRPPFEGSDAGSVLAQHLTQEPPALRSIRPDVPDDLAAALRRCLAKEPAGRWPDARAFREAVAPTRLDDEELPEPLDGLDGRAAMLLPFAILLLDCVLFAFLPVALGDVSLSGALGWRTTGPGAFNPFFSLGAVRASALVSVLAAGFLVYQLPWLASAARLARQRGFSSQQVVAAFLRQPAWWYLFWYPRRFRRAGDVWERLPGSVRRWRLSITLLAADAALIAPLAVYALAYRALWWESIDQGSLVAVLLFTLLSSAWWGFAWLLLVSLALLAWCARDVLALGLDAYQRRRLTSVLLTHPTSARAAWRRPELARLLSPAPAQPGTPTEPRLPSEFAEAIGHAADPGAASEARALVAELEALDAEIERLGREADPDEAARLRQRLQALGPEAPSEGDERRQMRRLLTEQAGLLAKVAERLEQARSRRAERSEELRDLWRRARVEAAPTFTRAEGE